jgi:hypothetical protein
MARRSNPYLLHASIRKDAQVDYDAYPFNIPAVREIGDIDRTRGSGSLSRTAGKMPGQISPHRL